MPTWDTKPSTIFRYLTNGGGGFGDPLEREPERVMVDVRDGDVTIEGAARDYGVVVKGDPENDPEGLEVDAEGDERRRTDCGPPPAGSDRVGTVPPQKVERLREAMGIANIPTLLMVLVQLTGEPRWLEEPYRPARARGMTTTTAAGCPRIQHEIRDAALEAILAWRAGAPVAIPEPVAELLVEMLGCAMGEHVPPEYGPMIAAQLGLAPSTEDRAARRARGLPGARRRRRRVGLCARRSTSQQAGIPFTIVEKSDNVGGTWLDNRYPGAGVDTPSHLYSFSFARYDWSMYFALRDELHAYLERVADRVRPARAHPLRHRGRVAGVRRGRAALGRHACAGRTATSETLDANVVISGVGMLQPARRSRHPGPRALRRARRSTPRSGRTTSTSPASGWRSSATAPARCRSARDRRHGRRRSRSSSARRSGRRPFEQFRKPVPDADALPAARGAAVPVVVPVAPGLDVQRPDPPGAAEGPRVAASGARR